MTLPIKIEENDHPRRTAQSKGGSDFSYSPGNFYNNTWKRYTPAHNANVLLDCKPTFFSHKEMVAAAFVTNYLAADVRAVKRPLMAQIALREIATAERNSLSRKKSKVSQGLSKLKELLWHKEFFSEAYIPCGGLSAVSDIPSLSELHKMISLRSNWIWQLYEIAKIMHYVAIADNAHIDKRKLRPSFDRCFDIFESSFTPRSFDDGRLAKKQLHTAWLRYKNSISMIYAFANTPSVGDYNNLLDCFLSGDFDHRYLDELAGIRTAIGHSQHFCTVVLSKHADREIYDSNFIKGIPCDPIPLSPPILSESVLANIESARTRPRTR